VSRASGLPWLRLGEGYFTVEVSARPGSGKRGFLRTRPSGPVVALTSAPEKGRANRELIEFIAEILGVPTAAVSIINGQGARQKVIRVETASPQAMASKLAALANRA
jgi:uncharacterized protein